MRLVALVIVGLGAGVLVGFVTYAWAAIRMHQQPWVKP